MKRKAFALAAVFVPGVAAAHPDHLSNPSSGLAHLFTDPFHIALMAAAVLLIVILRQHRQRSTGRRTAFSRKLR